MYNESRQIDLLVGPLCKVRLEAFPSRRYESFAVPQVRIHSLVKARIYRSMGDLAIDQVSSMELESFELTLADSSGQYGDVPHGDTGGLEDDTAIGLAGSFQQVDNIFLRLVEVVFVSFLVHFQ